MNAEAPILDLAPLGKLFRREWRLLAAVPSAVGLVVFVLVFLQRDRFSATVALVPETRLGGSSSQLAGLAALAGVNLAGTGGSQGPQFYAALLTSRPIVYAVLRRHYGLASADSASLIDLLGVKGATQPERLWKAARKLESRTGVSTDIRTSVIHVVVDMPSPELAAQVANAYVDELNRFNRESRQSQARVRRVFVEGRVREAERELAAAEEAVRAFLERNRAYDRSPSLQFELSRLQRAYTVQSELYLDLRRQLDAARIAEVDDVPVLTTIEGAIPPARKSGPHRLRWVFSSFVGTMALVAFWLGSRRLRDVAG